MTPSKSANLATSHGNQWRHHTTRHTNELPNMKSVSVAVDGQDVDDVLGSSGPDTSYVGWENRYGVDFPGYLDMDGMDMEGLGEFRLSHILDFEEDSFAPLKSAEPWSQLQFHAPSPTERHLHPYSRGQGLVRAEFPLHEDASKHWRAEPSQGGNSSLSSFADSQPSVTRFNEILPRASFTSTEDRAMLEIDDLVEHPMDVVDESLSMADYAADVASTSLSSSYQMADAGLSPYLFDAPHTPLTDDVFHGGNIAMAVPIISGGFKSNSIHSASTVGASAAQSMPTEPLYPGGMHVPPSSSHFQDDLSSSWPPTRDYFPPTYAPSTLPHKLRDEEAAPYPKVRPRGTTISTIRVGEQSPLQATPPAQALRKRNSTRKSRSNSLTENKGPPSPIKANARKGGRKGKLPDSLAPIVAQKRQDRSVCIPCRLRRVTCPRPAKDSPCQWCYEHDYICVPASFTDISDFETSNCIFQTFSAYSSLDRSELHQVHYGPLFDLPALMETLRPYHQKFEARVLSFTGTFWKINLSICYRLLSQLAIGCRGRPLQLQEMVIGKRDLLHGWVDCIRPTEPDFSTFERFYRYGNMPSRNIYSLASLADCQPDRSLNIEDAEDATVIKLIIQLCRVVLRALEITALRELQQKLNDLNRGRKSSEEICQIVLEVARLLGSLRWRLAWWQKVEIGYSSRESVHRTTELTRILYFWFFTARKKLPEATLESIPLGYQAVYADVGAVWDDFPVSETEDDFRTWIFRAHHIIDQHQKAGTLQAPLEHLKAGNHR